MDRLRGHWHLSKFYAAEATNPLPKRKKRTAPSSLLIRAIIYRYRDYALYTGIKTIGNH